MIIPIPGHESYGVDDTGVVYRIVAPDRGSAYRRKVPYPLKPYFDKDGYLRASIRSNGKQVRPSISRFVCLAFNGSSTSEDMTYVCHRNGIKTDNRPENLYWGTPAHNGKDKTRLGEAAKGSRHNKAKLTEKQVLEIRALKNEGVSAKELCIRFNMSTANMSKIINRSLWKHI